ncbi:MAG: ABC transporter substrate-binding protein [Bdellovibrionales bacterium]
MPSCSFKNGFREKLRILVAFFIVQCCDPVVAKSLPIQVGSSPVLSSAGLYLAQSEGYFAEQNLDVQIVDIPNSGAPMTLLLAKGKLDVGAGNLTSGLFTAIAKDKAIKLVADKGHVSSERDYIALIVRQDHLDSGRYKELNSLKGFKMGLTSLDGVSQQIVTERFLKKAGLSESDIEYVKLSYAEMNAALKTKSLDATIQLEPHVAHAELGGFAKRLAGAAEVHPGQQSAALLYSSRFASNRPQEAAKFMVAYLKGVRLYNKSLSDPKARVRVRAALAKPLKIVDEDIWDRMRPIGLAPDGRLNIESLQEDLDWYSRKGYLKTNVRAKDIVDHQFVDKAVKQLDGGSKLSSR